MNVCRYFAPYRYSPPMPLEDVSNNYFYCMPGGLPPLAPRKKKKVINDKTDNNNNYSNNNNNNVNIINIPPTTTPVIVPTTTPTPDSLEEEPPFTPWWGWTVYYWFLHTFPRWYKFFGLIYLFLVDLVDYSTGKDWADGGGDDDDININNNINVNNEEEEDEDEWIHGVSHTNYYDYYDDEVPIEDEFAPPEAEEQLDFEALRLLLLPQQEEEPTATSSDIATTTIDDTPYYYDLDDEDDDDGSDYYFSLPSENAINSFIATEVSNGETGDEDINFGMAEAKEIDDIMPVLEAFDATEDVPEATLASDDATEDVEASKSIDEVSTSKDTAALGSIWVPDPQFGMVRRSARLRVRG
jgi:hypothetical protein